MMKPEEIILNPGPVVLFGSGETSPSGRKIFDRVLRKLPHQPKIALLETPAGFELNSAQVIGRVADFMQHRLQNYEPQITVVPARKRGSAYSPDDPDLIAPLFEADMIFMGPGSPSYAVRQLRGSLAWYAMLANHRLGAALVFASAATVAASLHAIPVYEIYKVGEDPHWKSGLDFFGTYGLPLVFVPHWNNQDGGDELDTSRCFMGKPRFAELMDMIPSNLTILGIDEKTALMIEPENCTCRVIGLGGVTLIHTGPAHRNAAGLASLDGTGLDEVAQARQSHVHQYLDNQLFSLQRIGQFQQPQDGADLPEEIWKRAVEARLARQAQRGSEAVLARQDIAPDQVLDLLEERQAARVRKDWRESDRLRDQMAELGWQVQDTPQGPKLLRSEN